MKSRILCCAILLTAMPLTAALAHPGHIAEDGYGHTHWLAIVALVGVAAVGVTAWLRRRSATGRGVAPDREL